MNPVKTLYVFNREIWPELLTQKDELSRLGQPYVDYSESSQVTTQFTDIPFEGPFIPYIWIAQNIVPLSDGTYDQIIFHVPTDQWKGGSTNGFTLGGHGRPTVVCVHSFQGEQLFNNPDPKWKDRGFYERTQHEFAHAYCDIKGIQDAYEVPNPTTGKMETHWKVHDIEDAGGLWKQPWFDYIGLTTPNTTSKFALMQKVIDSLKAQLAIVTAAINKGKLAILQEETGAKWIGSPNKIVGRGGYKPEAIVIHIMDGTLVGTDAWFSTPKSVVSSHYGIGKTGIIHQYVREEDTAWHAGFVLNPTWKLIKPGVSPNLYCVTPDTKILTQGLSWVKAGELQVGDKIMGFDEEPKKSLTSKGGRRYFHRAEVTALERKMAPVFEIRLSDGTVLHSTDEHRWLYHKGKGHGAHWIRTDKISESLTTYKRTNPLYFTKYFPVFEKDTSFEGGFLAAAFDGEGNFRFTKGEGIQLCFTQKDNAMLTRVTECLDKFHFSYGLSHHRLSNCKTLYLTGGKQEVFRFLMFFQPPRLLKRYQENILEHLSLWPASLVQVEEVKTIGEREIIAFSSSTKTYIAEGFGSHNTIGIEHEGTADTIWPDAMKQATATLIKDICNRWKIPLDRDHIIGHYEIAGGHRPNCPSKNKGIVDELIALAKSK